MDFLDWISEGANYLGDGFEAVANIFSDTPEQLGGETPVMETAATDTLAAPAVTEEAAVEAFKQAGSVENFAKWIEQLPSESKRQFEKLLDNKLAMAGIAGGMKAALGMRAADRMQKAQQGLQDDQQQFLTDTQQRRGSAPTAIASVKPRGLAEGYMGR